MKKNKNLEENIEFLKNHINVIGIVKELIWFMQENYLSRTIHSLETDKLKQNYEKTQIMNIIIFNALSSQLEEFEEYLKELKSKSI